MKKLVITTILTLVVFKVFGQIDSIAKQIMNYGDSKSVIISKGRSLLLDKFLENDIDMVREVKNYLIEKGEDENYIAFYPAEYWYILYWTSDYEELSNSIKAFDSTAIASYYSRIHPFEDVLITQLRLKTREHAQKIITKIQGAVIDDEMKSFLLLNFESMTMKDESFQDALNIQADNFLKTYPETEYKDFINKYVRVKYVPKNWRATLEFFLVSGYGMLTGELNNNYTNNILPFGFSIDVYYKRFELYLRFAFVNNKTKRDFDYSTGVYEKGSTMQIFFPEASLGFAALQSGRFKLAPFAGIGAVSIGVPLDSSKRNPALKELSQSAFSYNVGATIDIKLGKMGYQFRPTSNGGFIRIRYGYSMPQFSSKHNGMSGAVHQISIGYGIFLSALRREE
ncbi:MAG: hypothetical protein FWE30_05200 [Bacteroidales bacterium]|nr:hypothetical protein [Bacteroidales bacterium]